MKINLLKAVPTLLFLLVPTCFFAQTIQIHAFEKGTDNKIEYVSIAGFSKGKQKSVVAKIPYAIFKSYDSLLVQAFGYKSHWIKDYNLPESMDTSITMPLIVRLEVLHTDVNEVIISAGKFKEKKKDVARQINILKQEDIEAMSPATTADLLQNSGNVLVQKSQLGGGSPVIRGFEANKVQIVIDGVRLNNAIYRGGHLQNVLRIDNNALERVEVIHGAGSVIYGSDALGGVMHFVTKKPQLSDTGGLLFMVGANARYGSAANELGGSFNFNFGWKNVGLFTNFSYNQIGDLRQGGNGLNDKRKAWEKNYVTSNINGRDTMLPSTTPLVQSNSGYTQVDFLQKVLIKQSETVQHSINFQYSSTGDVPRYDRQNQTDSAQNADIKANRFTGESLSNPYRYAEWYYGPEERLMASYSLHLKKHLPNSNKLRPITQDVGRITAAFQNITESRHNRRFGSSKRTDRVENVKVASVNADFQTQKRKNEIRYGGEFIYNKVNSTAEQVNIFTGATNAATTRYPGEGSTMMHSALYATLNRELGKGLILNAGLRYNLVTLNAKFGDTAVTKFPFAEANQTNTALNGNLGLVYNSPKGWRFSGMLSSGFRAANVDDLGKVFDSNPNDSIVIVPNPDILPELTYNAEVSISKLLGSKGMVELVGWYTVYKDAIVTQAYTLNGSETILYDGVPSRVFANQNASNAYLYGGSLNVQWQAVKKLIVNGTVSYTYGRIVTDSTPYPLAHIPPVYGRVGAKWKEKEWGVELYSLFNGAKKVKDYNIIGEDNYYESTIDGMPAWYTLNIRGQYQLSESTSLQVAIENILDQNYRVFASGISAPGRNIIVTLRAWL